MAGQGDRGRRWKKGLSPDLGFGLSEKTRQALEHPVRRIILRRLHETERAESPVEMVSLVAGLTLGLASYHAGILRNSGVTRLDHTGQVRGATQHFYVSAVDGDPEVEEVLAATEAEDREPRGI
jgi:DNA-binding transcriptional ArsR family regulator